MTIVVLCSLAPAAGCSASAPPVAAVSHPSPKHEPSLARGSVGQIVTPSLNATKKATAFIFVLPDCPICNAYLPELNRLHDAFAPRGVGMVIVHVDPGITAERAGEHAKEYGIRPSIALDPRHEWVKRAGATVAPEAIVFSPDGEVLYRGRINDQYAGLGKRRAVVTSHDLQGALEAILAGQLVPVARTEAVGCPVPELTTGE